VGSSPDPGMGTLIDGEFIMTDLGPSLPYSLGLCLAIICLTQSIPFVNEETFRRSLA